MSLSGSATGTTTTDAGGTYSFTENAGGSYTVTPSLGGYSFAPTSQPFNNLAANGTANFTATFVPNITVATSPAGLAVIVDSVSMTAPASLYWAPGSNHTLNVSFTAGQRQHAVCVLQLE